MRLAKMPLPIRSPLVFLSLLSIHLLPFSLLEMPAGAAARPQCMQGTIWLISDWSAPILSIDLPHCSWIHLVTWIGGIQSVRCGVGRVLDYWSLVVAAAVG